MKEIVLLGCLFTASWISTLTSIVNFWNWFVFQWWAMGLWSGPEPKCMYGPLMMSERRFNNQFTFTLVRLMNQCCQSWRHQNIKLHSFVYKKNLPFLHTYYILRRLPLKNIDNTKKSLTTFYVCLFVFFLKIWPFPHLMNSLLVLRMSFLHLSF